MCSTRYWHHAKVASHSLSTKTVWRKVQYLVIWYPVSCKSCLLKLKEAQSKLWSKYDVYEWSMLSLGCKMTWYCTLRHTFLFFFSAQIFICRPVTNFAWCQQRMADTRYIYIYIYREREREIHIVMMDTLKIIWIFTPSIENMIYYCTIYSVSLISDIVNCIFRP